MADETLYRLISDCGCGDGVDCNDAVMERVMSKVELVLHLEKPWGVKRYPLKDEAKAYERLGCYREGHKDEHVWLERRHITKWEKVKA